MRQKHLPSVLRLRIKCPGSQNHHSCTPSISHVFGIVEHMTSPRASLMDSATGLIALGLMLCCHCPEILKFWKRGPTFSFLHSVCLFHTSQASPQHPSETQLLLEAFSDSSKSVLYIIVLVMPFPKNNCFLSVGQPYEVDSTIIVSI